MGKDIHMVLKVDIDRPFHKSSGIINFYLWSALKKAGYNVEVFPQKRPAEITHGERLLQLDEFALLHRIALVGDPDITLYCGQGLGTQTPKARPHHKNIVFLHGIRGFPGILVRNPAIDVYWCNSQYLKSVLSSIMLIPDFARRCVLDPQGHQSVESIPLPIPLLDYPDGYENEGVELPSEVVAALKDGATVIGHSVQRDKPCPIATCMIMRALNEMAEQGGLPTFRLVISQAVAPELTDEIKVRWPDEAERMQQWFIPVPLINNRALITLMRRSAFGLCYNRYPESFGIYPLESVLVGCPVYTNGIGNNRTLLPPDNGITVIETIGMSFGEYEDYRCVAERIIADLQSGEAVQQCQQGGAYIAQNHNRQVFDTNVEAALSQLEREATVPQTPSIDNLLFEISPLVRLWNPDTGQVVSDYRSTTLTPAEIDLVCSLLGRSFGSVAPRDTGMIEQLYSLFYRGILTLRSRNT